MRLRSSASSKSTSPDHDMHTVNRCLPGASITPIVHGGAIRKLQARLKFDHEPVANVTSVRIGYLFSGHVSGPYEQSNVSSL